MEGGHFHTGRASDCQLPCCPPPLLQSVAISTLQVSRETLEEIGARKVLRVIRGAGGAGGGGRTSLISPKSFGNPSDMRGMKRKLFIGDESFTEFPEAKKVRYLPPASYCGAMTLEDALFSDTFIPCGMMRAVPLPDVISAQELVGPTMREIIQIERSQEEEEARVIVDGEARPSDMRGDQDGRPTSPRDRSLDFEEEEDEAASNGRGGGYESGPLDPACECDCDSP